LAQREDKRVDRDPAHTLAGLGGSVTGSPGRDDAEHAGRQRQDSY
jgi:hypothetical protein